MAVGVVAKNVPALVAHWHDRDATAVIPVMFVAAVAVVCMPVMSPLLDGVWEPYRAPARAALFRAWDVWNTRP